MFAKAESTSQMTHISTLLFPVVQFITCLFALFGASLYEKRPNSWTIVADDGMARRLLNVVTFAILPLLAQCAATADDGDAAVEPRHIREYAFVSVLSSDDFLLAARVLGKWP